MTTDTVLQIGTDAVRAFSQQLNEPDWLTQIRLEALELAGKLELPILEKTRIDRWDLDHFGTFKQDEKIESLDKLPQQFQELITDGVQNMIVQRNASVIYNELSDELKQQGVIFTDLHTAAREHADLVQKYLFQVVKKDEHRLAALHAALWSGGMFLYVPKNTELKLPLQGLFYSDDRETVFSPHILIVAEANSSVTYVSNYTSIESEKNLVHNSIVEIVAEPGARVQYASIQHLDEKVTDISFRRARIENDAHVEWIIGEMNSGNTASDIATVLKGNGSTSDAKVVSIGQGRQDLNITTRAVHFGKKSDSNMLARAVMRDRAQAIINGVTKIEKGATGANGEQTERVLMLSPNARGDANPILLIDEDDVTAGHAASAGQVDRDQVYYLMSRGISEVAAEALIIRGFLEPIVSLVAIESVREQLSNLIERKLQ